MTWNFELDFFVNFRIGRYEFGFWPTDRWSLGREEDEGAGGTMWCCGPFTVWRDE